MTTITELTEKIAKLPTNLDRMDGIVNGPATGPTSEVPTDNGPVKTFARVVAENEATLGDAVVQIATARDEALGEIAGAGNTAQAWATNPEDEPVEPGQYSAYHWAQKAEQSATPLNQTNIQTAIADKAAFREDLELGAAATLATGTVAGTIAAGNDGARKGSASSFDAAGDYLTTAIAGAPGAGARLNAQANFSVVNVAGVGRVGQVASPVSQMTFLKDEVYDSAAGNISVELWFRLTQDATDGTGSVRLYAYYLDGDYTYLAASDTVYQDNLLTVANGWVRQQISFAPSAAKGPRYRIAVVTGNGAIGQIVQFRRFDVAPATAASLRLMDSTQGGTPTEAAIAAYATGIPFVYGGDSDLLVPISFTGATTDAQRFAILNAAQVWQGSCVLSGRGQVVLVIPDGLHKCGAGTILRGANAPTLNLRATATPEELAITAISSAALSGGLYTVTVTVSTALPARVVVDYPLGMQAITGNNMAASYNGALKVTTIAGNRLSFTAQMYFPSAPTAPTTLTAGATNSMTHNRLIVPWAALGFNGGTAAIEGFINFQEGGRGTDKYLGWVYYGSATDGTIFYLGQGAAWYSADKCVYVGGPERIFRLFNDPLYTANRCCFGGGNHSATNALVDSQSGGKLTIKRCSLGGGILRQILVGQGVQAELAQNWLTGGATAVLENAGGWITDLSVTLISHSAARGIYTRQGGTTLLAATTTIERATTGLAWLGLARYEGSPTFGTGITNQGTGPANSIRNGGMWQASTTVPVVSNKLALAPGNSNVPANNGEIEIEFTSNTTLTFRGRGADGLVRSGTVTLS